MTCRASSRSLSTVLATTPRSAKARIVSAGIVFTVCGPISGSTYRISS
jgi:hypothetical protein